MADKRPPKSRKSEHDTLLPRPKLEHNPSTTDLTALPATDSTAPLDPSALLDPDPTLPADAHAQALPLLAWARIIDRAQRGIGDASYNSDDDDVAREEASDERPRAELTRVVRALAGVHAGGFRREGPRYPLASDDALAYAKARCLHPQQQ